MKIKEGRKLKGEITINNTNYKDYYKADSILIEIQDKKSGLPVIDIVIPYNTLIQAIGHYSYQPIDYTIYPIENHGKKMIVESFNCPEPEKHLNHWSDESEKELLAYLKPYIEEKEAEGWTVSTDFRTKNGTYRLTLRKWVNEDEEINNS